jgi:hypothetical protein
MAMQEFTGYEYLLIDVANNFGLINANSTVMISTYTQEIPHENMFCMSY